MKNKMKKGFMLAFIGTAMFLTGCSDTESITPDDTTKYAGQLDLNDAVNDDVTIYAEDVTGNEIKTLVNLTSTGDNMRRVYITRNVGGAGDEPFTLTGDNVKTNGDGSVNLDAAKTFTLELNVPKNTTLAVGTEVYKIWATDGKGDYRDTTNSFEVGIGTVTIQYGAGTNPAADVKHFETTILAAPLANGTSKTFMSTVNGVTYDFAKLENGDAPDTAQFWDLGYYYGADGHASLASAFNYPTDIVDVATISGIAKEDLHKCYFVKSTKTVDQFNAITKQSQLEDAVSASTSDDQRINLLSTSATLGNGNMIEFVDGYGKKGMIRVLDITKDTSGGYTGTGASITIEVKVQR